MRFALIAAATLLAACDPADKAPQPHDPDNPYNRTNGASMVVAEKIAPDTLIDTRGRWCALTAPEYGFEWMTVEVGQAYARPACAWSDSAHVTWADSVIVE